jgi:hypothetical protein
MSERLPGKRNPPPPAQKAHPITGAAVPGRRHSKKPTSALGKIDRPGRAVPGGPRAVAPGFTMSGRVAPKRAPKLSKADAKAVQKAAAAKRPSKAQKELLGAAAVRKASINRQRSATAKANAGRKRKLKGLAAVTSSGKYTPSGPRF